MYCNYIAFYLLSYIHETVTWSVCFRHLHLDVCVMASISYRQSRTTAEDAGHRCKCGPDPDTPRTPATCRPTRPASLSVMMVDRTAASHRACHARGGGSVGASVAMAAGRQRLGVCAAVEGRSDGWRWLRRTSKKAMLSICVYRKRARWVGRRTALGVSGKGGEPGPREHDAGGGECSRDLIE